jgi:hypothetical protein
VVELAIQSNNSHTEASPEHGRLWQSHHVAVECILAKLHLALSRAGGTNPARGGKIDLTAFLTRPLSTSLAPRPEHAAGSDRISRFAVLVRVEASDARTARRRGACAHAQARLTNLRPSWISD